MARFLKFEETEEGTALLTYDLGIGEESFLLPVPFEHFLSIAMLNEGARQVGEEMGQHLIHIPSSTEDL